MLLAVLGGIAFIYLQNVFLIDYAYEFNGSWQVSPPPFMILVIL